MSEGIGCIYLITNEINCKQYVGRTCNRNPTNRYRQHWYNARKGSITPLHKAMRKYGPTNFKIEVLSVAPINSLNNLEAYWADRLETYIWSTPIFHPPGYNVLLCGTDINIDDQRNKSYFSYKYKTAEDINKFNSIRKNVWKGRKHTLSTCIKIGNIHRGKIIPKEVRDKMSKAHTGTALTKEHIDKARVNRIQSVIENGAKGVKLSREQIIDIVNCVNIGQTQTEIAKKYNIRVSLVSRIINGQRWGYITGIEEKETKKKSHPILGITIAREIRELYSKGCETYQSLANKYNVNKSTIGNIIKGKLYRESVSSN